MSTDQTTGAPFTELQQRLYTHNLVRLEKQRLHGNEPPRRHVEPTSLLDLVVATAKTSQSNFVLRRVL